MKGKQNANHITQQKVRGDSNVENKCLSKCSMVLNAINLWRCIIMKMFFKKSLSIFLTLVLMLSIFSISSYAISAEELVTEKNITINEWDEYKSIVSKTDNELIELGCTEEDIANIRKFNYEEEIRNRAALDDQALKSYGYTTEEITELRKAAAMDNIPENVIQAISTATMTSKLSYVSNGSRKENNSTMYYVNMKYSWSWSRIPFFRVVDMVAVVFASSTSNSFTYCVQSNNKVHADLISVHPSYSTYSQVEPWVYSTKKANSISAKFALALTDGNGVITHFAYRGYGTFQLTNRSNKARLYVDAAYGHTTINIVPNYSLSGSGLSVGIDFRVGMDEQHCTGYFYENFTIAKNYIYHGTVYGKNGTGGTAA